MKTLRLVSVIVALLTLVGPPQPARGQAPAKPHRVGVIAFSGYHQVIVDGLRQGLRDLGLEEGKDYVLVTKQVKDGDRAAFGAAARDLEQAKVELIYTITTQVTLLVKEATTKVPIVFYMGVDPVATGLVESYAKPGGRFTGVH